MVRAWKFTWLACFGLLIGAAHAQPGQVAMTLERALVADDSDALAAAGLGLGPIELERALARGTRRTRLAATRAAPSSDQAWSLLVPLAAAGAGPDRPIAVAATRAARDIARTLDRKTVVDHDVPEDSVRASLEAWRAIAIDPSRWSDVRVGALEIGRALHDALGEDALPEDVAYPLGAVSTDLDPEIRRAGLELLPQEEVPFAAVASSLQDADPVVALVAAQVMCAGLAFDDAPAPIMDAVGPGGLERIRAVIALPDQPPPAVLDAARCLARDDGSAATLKRLAATGPRAIRAELRALTRKRK